MKKIYLLMLALLGFFVTSNGQVIDVVGVGMVNQSTANLTFTDHESITLMTVRAVYKESTWPNGTAPEGTVTFEDDDEPASSNWYPMYTEIVNKKNPAEGGNPYVGFWSKDFNTAEANGVEVVITDPDDNPHILSAYAFLYRTLNYTPTFTSYVSTQTAFYYHNGSADPYVYNIPIAAASEARKITVKVPISELDDGETGRVVVIDIAAGSVTLHAEELTWNFGESFFLGTYILEDVPGDVTNVTVSIYSPTIAEGDGDSFFSNGIVVDVDNECGECDGQITSLDLEYLGNEVDATIKVYSKKVEPNKLLATFTDVNNGDILSFFGDPDKQNKMGSKIRITVNDGNAYTEIHTSCSQDIYAGMVFGDYLILAGTSHEGGPLCSIDPPPSDDCGECDGQITSLDLEYLGNEVDATIKVYTKKVEPDKLLATFTNVNNGDILSFVGDPDKQNKMGSKIRITVNDGNAYTEIHTSCSQDIYAGMVFEDYLILAGTSHEGGPLCEIPSPPPPGDDCGECDGQITSLDLEYQGNEVDATIKVYTKKVEPDKLLATFTNVNAGDVLSFTGDPDKQNKMGSKIRITVNGGNDYTEIHTSCSQDIYVGMIFGDYEIIAGTSHEGGALCEDPYKSSSITTIYEFEELKVYPNPMSTTGTLNFETLEDANTTVEIYNIVGTRVDVLFNEYAEAESKISLNIDATKYPKGMYVIYIRNGSSILKEKLSIMN